MPKLNLFLSWSGEQSKAIAAVLKEWLPQVLGDEVAPWYSASDISAGSRFIFEIGRSLAASGVGILCLTDENKSAPWIAFEAGALSKSLSDAAVIPFVLDFELSDLSGPLAQFQAKLADQSGVFDVVTKINSLLDSPCPEATLKARFGALWPALETHFKRAMAMSSLSNVDGWWIYSLLAETASGLRETLGYFRIRESRRATVIEEGRVLWLSGVSFVHRGNWRSDRVWIRNNAIKFIYTLTSVAAIEGLPTEYDGYLEVARLSLTPILGESTWVGSFNDLGHRASIRGPVYAERLPQLSSSTGDDLKQLLAEHNMSLLERVREFWPQPNVT